jgi:hypothetical protein
MNFYEKSTITVWVSLRHGCCYTVESVRVRDEAALLTRSRNLARGKGIGTLEIGA